MADDAIKLPIEPELNMSRLDSQAKAAGKRLSDAIRQHSTDAGEGIRKSLTSAIRTSEKLAVSMSKLSGMELKPSKQWEDVNAQLELAKQNVTYLQGEINRFNLNKSIRGDFTQQFYDLTQEYDRLANAQRVTKERVLDVQQQLKELGDEKTNIAKLKQEFLDYAKTIENIDTSKLTPDEKLTIQTNLSDYSKRIDYANQRMVEIEKETEILNGRFAELNHTVQLFEWRVSHIANKMGELRANDGMYASIEKENQYLSTLQSRLEAEQGDVQRLAEELSGIENSDAMYILSDQTDKVQIAMQQAAHAAQQLNNNLDGVEQQAKTPGEETKRSADDASKAVNRLTNEFKKLVHQVSRLAHSAISRGFNALKNSLSGVDKSSDNASRSIKKLVKTMIRYGFGVRSFYFLFRKLRSAIIDAIKDMARIDTTGLGASITSAYNALQQLKYSWASAFAPIIEYVVPALVTLMNALSAVGDAVAALFATLTGKGTVVKAIATQKELSDALGDTAKSAGGAGKAADEALGKLADFDELNIIQDQNGSGGGGGGGGGGSGAGDNAEFVTETIENELADLINADKWFEIGQLIANNMNKIIESADDWLVNKFAPWAEKWAYNIGNLMNGFIYAFDWELLGKTFADGLNAIFNAANTWLKTVHWELLGRGVADSIISAIRNIDWELIGETLSNYFNKGIDYAFGLITRTFEGARGKDIGSSLATALNTMFTNMHWDSLFNTFVNLFNGAFVALKSFIANYNWNEIGNQIATSFNTAIRRLDPVSAAQSISSFIHNAFEQIQKLDLIGLGEQIGLMLSNIDWFDIISNVISIIGKVLLGIVKGAFEGEYGEQLAIAIVSALGLKIALAVGKFKLGKTLISSLFGTGAGAAAGAAAEGAKQFSFKGLFAGLGATAKTIAPWAAALALYAIAAKSAANGQEELLTQMKETYGVKDDTLEYIDSIAEIVSNTEALHEASKRQIEVYAEQDAKMLEMAKSYDSLIDANGNVKSGMEDVAETYLSKLAITYGMNIDDLKKLVKENGNLETAIENVIKSKENDRIASAYLDEYSSALETVGRLTKDTTKLENEYNDAKKIAEKTQQDYDRAYRDYVDHLGQGIVVEQKYKKKLDDATLANSNAQYALDKTKKALDDNNDQVKKLNKTVELYEGYMAAVATGDAKLINEALQLMTTGYQTAETGTKESLEAQVRNMEQYYNDLVTEQKNGNPKVTDEMIAEAKGWVESARKELVEFKNLGSHSARQWGQGMEDANSDVQKSTKKTANTIKHNMTNILNDVDLGTPKVSNVSGIGATIQNAVRGCLNGVNAGKISVQVPNIGYKGVGSTLVGALQGYTKLATGAVIPPNKEFLAMLGDQKHGVNVEAPLDTIKGAVREVLGENGGVSNSEVITLLQELISVVEAKRLTISSKDIGDTAIDEINSRTRRTGNTPILG